MEIKILQQQCGGTEFLACPHRLHLGAQNAEGVDRLHFILPDAWASCTVALHFQRRDGIRLAPIPLDPGGGVTVDRRLTGSVGGQWMLAAVQGENYTAYSRPGSYDVYATLPTDGGSEELPPSQYEQFVARVLESARAAEESARKAETGAADTAVQADIARRAADEILASRTDAADCARRAEEAAQRAERIAPTEGNVLSVNGRSGAVQLTAKDVGAVPEGSGGYVQSVKIQGNTLITTLGNGGTASQTVLGPATTAALGGIRVGAGLTVSTDGTLALTAAGLNTVLGYDLAEKLKRLGGMTDMGGKLIYTSAGTVEHDATTMTIPADVDYLVVRMAEPAVLSSSTASGAAAGAEYGVARVVRGGTAMALAGTSGDREVVKMSFGSNGTLSIAGHANLNDYTSTAFNLEGYQYV